MAYTAITPPTTGTPISTSAFGIPVVNAITEMWQGAAAGDLAYYSSATTMARLAGGTANAGKVLMMGTAGSAPEWGDTLNIVARQGGSSTDWNTAGTINYTPDKSIMQVGAAPFPVTSGEQYFSKSITFPVAFSAKPIIFVTFTATVGMAGSTPYIRPTSITTTGFSIYVIFTQNQVGSYTFETEWFAIGPSI